MVVPSGCEPGDNVPNARLISRCGEARNGRKNAIELQRQAASTLYSWLFSLQSFVAHMGSREE